MSSQLNSFSRKRSASVTSLRNLKNSSSDRRVSLLDSSIKSWKTANINFKEDSSAAEHEYEERKSWSTPTGAGLGDFSFSLPDTVPGREIPETPNATESDRPRLRARSLSASPLTPKEPARSESLVNSSAKIKQTEVSSEQKSITNLTTNPLPDRSVIAQERPSFRSRSMSLTSRPRTQSVITGARDSLTKALPTITEPRKSLSSSLSDATNQISRSHGRTRSLSLLSRGSASSKGMALRLSSLKPLEDPVPAVKQTETLQSSHPEQQVQQAEKSSSVALDRAQIRSRNKSIIGTGHVRSQSTPDASRRRSLLDSSLSSWKEKKPKPPENLPSQDSSAGPVATTINRTRSLSLSSGPHSAPADKPRHSRGQSVARVTVSSTKLSGLTSSEAIEEDTSVAESKPSDSAVTLIAPIDSLELLAIIDEDSNESDDDGPETVRDNSQAAEAAVEMDEPKSTQETFLERMSTSRALSRRRSELDSSTKKKELQRRSSALVSSPLDRKSAKRLEPIISGSCPEADKIRTSPSSEKENHPDSEPRLDDAPKSKKASTSEIPNNRREPMSFTEEKPHAGIPSLLFQSIEPSFASAQSRINFELEAPENEPLAAWMKRQYKARELVYRAKQSMSQHVENPDHQMFALLHNSGLDTISAEELELVVKTLGKRPAEASVLRYSLQLAGKQRLNPYEVLKLFPTTIDPRSARRKPKLIPLDD